MHARPFLSALWLRRLVPAAVTGLSLVFAGQLSVQASHRTFTPEAAALPTIHWPGMVGYSSWFSSLDPAYVADGTAMETIYKIQAPMLKLLPGARYNVTQGLASLKVSKDKLTLTFTLRKNLKFSNGDPLTTRDVAFTLSRELAPATGSATATTRLGNIEGALDFHSGKSPTLAGVKVVNARVIQVRAATVDSSFPLSFALYPTQILDHKVLEGKPTSLNNNYMTNTCSANVGAGPFKLVCRNKDSNLNSFYPSGATPSITMVPNPYYYGAKPKFRLVEQVIKDAQTAYLDFQAGQLDATPLPSQYVDPNRTKKGFMHWPGLVVTYLSPAVDIPPFDNVHCRLALAYAINIDQINKTVLHGTQTTIHDMVPKPLNGYYNGKGAPSYNPTKAKSELAQCPGGIHDVKLTYDNSSSDNDLVYAGAIPAQLAAVGIDVKGAGVSGEAINKLSTTPQKQTGTQLLAAALGASNAAITCRTRSTGYVLNTSGWSSSEFDGLCQKALKTFDLKKQAKVYQQAQNLALNQASWITIGQSQNFALVKPWLKGVTGDPYYGVVIAQNYDWAKISILKH